MDATSRRTFLKSTTAASAALAFGTVANAQENPAPISVCVMGVNSRGQAHAQSFSSLKYVDVRYICDVDETAANKCAADIEKRTGKRPEIIRDFRKALDDNTLTALSVATPDHWHAIAAILACKAGKHVYCEKPTSHNAREGEILVEVAKKTKRIVQIGTQRRTSPSWISAIQTVKDGAIGKITFAKSWYTNARAGIGKGKPANPPAGFDWTLWQGAAPERPFMDNYIHYKWHWFWHWGTGELGNNGVHTLDLCRWALNLNEPPKTVSSLGGRYSFDDDQQTPDTNVVTYDYGNMLMNWECRSCQPHGIDGEQVGVAFYGDKGTIIIDDKKCNLYDNKDKLVKSDKTSVQDAPHFQNFVDAIRADDATKLAAPVEQGVASTLLSHLGNISWKLRRTITLDPAGKPTGPDIDPLWTREYREGWTPTV